MRFSELEGARVGVWGAGREISSFAAQLRRRLPTAEIAVAVFDEEFAQGAVAGLGYPDVRVVAAARAQEALAGCRALVRSPGVTIHRPELEALRSSGLPVTTATSLWMAEREGRAVLGVTGTKGKSTTAALAHHLAVQAGAKAHLAGNIGVPALDLLDLPAEEPAVVELSSYQIADLATAPETALLTNLYREHLDWHGSEQAYRAEKLRLFELPGLRAAVLPAAFAAGVQTAAGVSRTGFGTLEGWHVDQSGAVMRGGEPALPAAGLPLPGAHNALNLCAALAGLEAAGMPVPEPAELGGALAGFAALPHRLQTVAEQDGVRWVDDSISTTPESALAALASFPGAPLVLLAGGQDRGQDYAGLAAELARLGAAVVGLPSTGPRLLAAARAAGVPAERALETSDLAGAVGAARELAGPGAVVLLSPAAPSYDHYRDFEERGERFAALVTDPAAAAP